MLKAQIRKWNPKVDWAPKDLRNCLPTFSVIEGLQSDLREQYIGHAPRTVTGRHYVPRLAAATGREGDILVRQMNLFRKRVTNPLDEAFEKMARKRHNQPKTQKSVEVLDMAKSSGISV